MSHSFQSQRLWTFPLNILEFLWVITEDWDPTTSHLILHRSTNSLNNIPESSKQISFILMFSTHTILYHWVGWLNWWCFWLVFKKSLVWILARAVTAVSQGIPHSPQANAGRYLKLDHAYLIPHTSKFIIDYQKITGCYILWVAKFNTNINTTLC